MYTSSSLYCTAVILCALVLGQCSAQCPTMRTSEEAHQELLKSQLQFSVDLLQNIGTQQSEGNVFFSPSSVFNALILAYIVSAKHTEASLRQILHIPDTMDKNDILGAYSWLVYDQDMRSVNGSTKYDLSNVNRIYITDKETVQPCLMKDLKREIVMADFTKNISATVALINKFVSTKTKNEINNFLSPDSLNENTNLVLVNAAYFRGLWKHPFSPKDTRKATFKTANGTAVPITVMTQENKFKHWINEDLEAEVLELPYKEADISMFIVLPLTPSKTAIHDLINKTDVNILQDITNFGNDSAAVTVTIPKFTVDQTLELTPILEAMGVGDLFQLSADLSVLTGKPGLKLDRAIHKAKVVVNEVGTIAAAATAIFSNRFATDVIYVDHPFLFFIYDKMWNTILFAGVFNSPDT